ncbi:hypothetical protein BT96DRAFT_933073 [Gymnopus androsaceus JB14]|uniref:Uncharacterized protein n=1 Tax=Gymnopus androsaceus JB14 TaxID=1447944 RepID=A0A6A4IG61_9AGAR|nr:hypothetical protein BT96DRAFT_933073 [Gymnopus androsaceus JB14]
MSLEDTSAATAGVLASVITVAASSGVDNSFLIKQHSQYHAVFESISNNLDPQEFNSRFTTNFANGVFEDDPEYLAECKRNWLVNPQVLISSKLHQLDDPLLDPSIPGFKNPEFIPFVETNEPGVTKTTNVDKAAATQKRCHSDGLNSNSSASITEANAQTSQKKTRMIAYVEVPKLSDIPAEVNDKVPDQPRTWGKGLQDLSGRACSWNRELKNIDPLLDCLQAIGYQGYQALIADIQNLLGLHQAYDAALQAHESSRQSLLALGNAIKFAQGHINSVMHDP